MTLCLAGEMDSNCSHGSQVTGRQRVSKTGQAEINKVDEWKDRNFFLFHFILFFKIIFSF